MKRYEFVIEIVGEGHTKEEAWLDATDAFAVYPGDCPDDAEELED